MAGKKKPAAKLPAFANAMEYARRFSKVYIQSMFFCSIKPAPQAAGNS
jgi:hypothetical protein